MSNSSKKLLVGAAVLGLVSGGILNSTTALANKDEQKPVCVNGCNGKGDCSVEGKHDCHGKAKKGEGWIKASTKEECEKKKGTWKVPH